MRELIHRWRFKLATIAMVVGPGIIAANADNDAGGITTLTVSGSRFGYGLLFSLLVTTICLAVTQEMGARIGIVTGKGLGGVIREQFGVKSTMLAMVVMLLANIGVIVANFAGLAEAFALVGISKYITIPIALVLINILLIKGNYNKIEKFFLILSSIYVVYIIAAFKTHPDWGQALSALVVPQFRLEKMFVITFMALVGTTITPWGQFFIQSYVVDKGIHIKNYIYEKFEVFLGALVTDGVSFFIIVTAANTLYNEGIVVQSAGEAAMALAPLADNFAKTLFAIGLMNASLLGAFIVPLATAYAVCEAFGVESGIDHQPSSAPVFFSILAGLMVLSAAIVLIPGMPLFSMIVMSQFFNALLLPVILIYVYKIANNKVIMGKHVNGRIMNFFTMLTIGVLMLASGFVLFSTFMG